MSEINLKIQIGNTEIRFSDLDDDKESLLEIEECIECKTLSTYLDKENIISINKYLEYLIGKL